MSVSFDLTGRVALITGGNRGIGREIALAFAQAGAQVAIAGRDPTTLAETATALRQFTPRAEAVQADVARVSDIEAMIEQVRAALGPIDILVNNAAIAILEPSQNVSEEHWDAVMNTNLKGMFFCASRASHDMIARRRGNIINIASEEGLIGIPGHATYCISKAGIIQMTKTLALEWGPYGIRVNAIAPAAVRTQMNETYWLSDALAYRWVVGRIALGRVSEPREVVGAALYLASEASSFVTGHTLVVDGGITAGVPRPPGSCAPD